MARVAGLLACALVVASVLGAGILGARADAPRNFRAVLTGENEVPARDTQARGVAVFQVEGNTITFRLIAANIDNAFAAHIHCGAPGVNGPVRITLFAGAIGGGRFDGVLSTGSASLAGVTCPNGNSLLSEIEAGNAYVNVHTNDGVDGVNTGPGDFPGGEIRGQIFG
jgi:hypothetical protein